MSNINELGRKSDSNAPDIQESNSCEREGPEELEAVQLYTPTKQWQTVGMWFGDYAGYVETLEEAEQVMLEYEITTGSKYIIGYKRRNFGNRFLDLHRERHKVNFVSKNMERSLGVPSCGSLEIPFDGVPYIVAGKKVLGCRHGSDKGTQSKQKWKKIAQEKVKTDPKFKLRSPRVQPSMKYGCKAEVHITHIIRFPDYEIPKDNSYYRRKTSDALKLTIHKHPLSLQPVDRFYLMLCDPKKHNHPLKDAKLLRKAHDLCTQSPSGHVKNLKRKRQSVPDEMALIQKELQMLHEDDAAVGALQGGVAPSPSSDVIDPSNLSSNLPILQPAPVSLNVSLSLNVSTDTNIPVVSSPPKTVAATRCAKILEKLINATFMVENADKLAELEQKANDLLNDANTSIKEHCVSANNETQIASSDSSIVTMPLTIDANDITLRGTVPIQTSTLSTAADEGSQRGPKAPSESGEGEEEGDYVPVTQSIEYVNVPGVQPSIAYTYGTNSSGGTSGGAGGANAPPVRSSAPQLPPPKF